jgi:transaldolase
VLLAKEAYPYLDGKVHAQTSPLAAICVENATEKTIQHAQKLVALFGKHGIKKYDIVIASLFSKTRPLA